MTNKLKYIVFSDIHFGSNKNKTELIVANLYRYFKKYDKLLKELDIIFIAGDIYDKLLSVASNDAIIALEWLTTLAIYCRNNKIRLRILEGTPSHDNKQAKMLDIAIQNLEIDVDFKYIEEIEVEYIRELDLNVLYIPDEMNHDAATTLQEVKDLMEVKSLQQVDIAIMHGAFNYQIPVIELPSMHDEQEYLSLVKYYISVGHVHNSSIYKRILAQGSFDRLSHNEEEEKGAFLITIEDGKGRFIFLENDTSLIFKSIDVNTDDMLELIGNLNKTLKDIPIGSHIRLIIENTNPIVKSILDISKRFPNYNFISKVVKEEEVKNLYIDNVLSNVKFDNLQITKDNISTLIMEEIDTSMYSDEILKTVENEFSNLL